MKNNITKVHSTGFNQALELLSIDKNTKNRRRKKKKTKNHKKIESSDVTLFYSDKHTILSCLSTVPTLITCTNHLLSSHSKAAILVKSHSISRKARNKLIKQVNGNGKKTFCVSHWNLGSKNWVKKRNQIQALVDQKQPDFLFISEANLDELTPNHESLIQGYSITLPKTVKINQTARLVLAIQG